jgi:hypothetical protein
VTWLLAKWKSSKILDEKAISAIVVFYPEEPEELTEEERERDSFILHCFLRCLKLQMSYVRSIAIWSGILLARGRNR